jgi:hypothetical protein
MTTTSLRTATAAALRADASARGLTVRQPWAACIAHWGKTIENRTWPPPYSGILLLIHAGQRADGPALSEALADLPGRDVRGAVVAVSRIAGCHRAAECPGTAGCQRWGDSGPRIWHWELADVLPLADPVPATGALSVWRPSPVLREAVTTALTAGEAR